MLHKLSDKLRKRQGFTLIEIVLVLAIAGLILLVVFLAVNGAQRSRRDTARKDYVNRVVAEHNTLTSDSAPLVNGATVGTAIGADIPTGQVAPVDGDCVTVGLAVSTGPYVDNASKQACELLEDGTVYKQTFRE